MFSEDFNKLQASEQLTFASVTNKLLLKGFIVRDIYDNREKIFRINPDYRFMERFFKKRKTFVSLYLSNSGLCKFTDEASSTGLMNELTS